MPFFPEFLFQLSARDQQVTWLDPVLLDISEGQALAAFSFTAYTVPLDHALVMQSVNLNNTPGGAQTSTQQSIELLSPAGSFASIIVGQKQAATAIPPMTSWSGSLIVPPRWRLVGVGSWNAGAAVNTLRVSMQGLLIPAGNIQRV